MELLWGHHHLTIAIWWMQQEVILENINDQHLQWFTTNCLNDYFTYCLIESFYQSLKWLNSRTYFPSYYCNEKSSIQFPYETDFSKQKLAVLSIPYTDNIQTKIKRSHNEILGWLVCHYMKYCQMKNEVDISLVSTAPSR